MGNFGSDYLTIGDGSEGSIKRSKSRDSLFLKATLQFAGEAKTREVRVRNLSENGMMAELDRVVPTGMKLTVEIRGVGEVAGRIAWCAEGRAGIGFDTPVDPMLARKPVGQAKR
jgi:hypothetical protein